MAKNNNPSYEEVFWKVESKDTQIHWIDKPKIVSAIEIEGASSSSGGGWAKTIIFDRPSWEGTWVQLFDWFWFTPTSYTIIAWSNYWSISWWAYDWNVSKCTYLFNYIGYADVSISSTKSIFIQSSASNRTQGAHDSFTWDWININFTESDVTTTLTITAYS